MRQQNNPIYNDCLNKVQQSCYVTGICFFYLFLPINICCIWIASIIFVVAVVRLWLALILASELGMVLLQARVRVYSASCR